MQERLSRLDTTHLMYILKGLLVGLLSGFVVSCFRLIIERSLAFWQSIYRAAQQQPWLLGLVLLGMLVMALVIGLITKPQPHIMGSGIPEVEGQLADEIKLPWWPILWRKFVTGVLGIGSGLFLGREGPSIQLGAAVGQGVASRFKNASTTERRVLLASGAASGLSAAFNAPIAGTMFVLEEVYHNFSPLVWMSALAGAIGANFVSTNFFGMVPVLHITYANSFPLRDYWHLLLLGILLGLLGYLYQQVLLWMPKLYHDLFPKLPRYFQGLVPLVLVIPIGYVWPQYLGGGNGVILDIGRHQPALSALVILLVLRFVFSMISYGSGLPGGIFLPILMLGAAIGATYGTIMWRLGLLPHNCIVNLLIFAMAGYFAGIGKAPFTAILLITEMVGTLQHLMPLAVVSLTAYLVVDLLGGAPIYASLLQRMQTTQKLEALTGHDAQIEIPILVGSAFSEQMVRDIHWPREMVLIAIRRGEYNLIPHGDTLLRAGDTLVILTDEGRCRELRHKLDKIGRRMLLTQH